MNGVESNGVPGIEESTWSAAATVWEARSAMTSSGENPASAKRARILVTVSEGQSLSKSVARIFFKQVVHRKARAPVNLETPQQPRDVRAGTASEARLGSC